MAKPTIVGAPSTSLSTSLSLLILRTRKAGSGDLLGNAQGGLAGRVSEKTTFLEVGRSVENHI